MLGGLLLTGGASRRLGTDKATLVLDGETLAARGAGLLAARCDVAIEVGPGHTGLRAVREEPPGGGPLAALVAGAHVLATAAAPPDAFVLLACDLPNAGPVLDALRAATGSVVVPVDGTGRRQYVCARYDAWVVGRAAALLHDGHRSLRELVASVPAGDVVELGGFAEDVLADVDVPADAERLGLRIRR